MSVSSLLSIDDIPVYRDMLSISTLNINFRIPPNLIIAYPEIQNLFHMSSRPVAN